MSSAGLLAKRGYVAVMRSARQAVHPTGLLDRPVSRESNRLRHWLQSLFAIYDIDELIRLDVPWWTYDAIEVVAAFLTSRDRPRVFEYGSGASTVWLAKRAQHVTSVDHHAAWVDRLRPRLGKLGNVTLELIEPDAVADPDPRFHSRKEGYRGRSFRHYVEAIARAEPPFDLIVIDGRARPACLAEAMRHLAKDGMIVFDNSHRPRYREALIGCGLTRSVMRGLVPSLPFPDETTLLRPTELLPGR